MKLDPEICKKCFKEEKYTCCEQFNEKYSVIVLTESDKQRIYKHHGIKWNINSVLNSKSNGDCIFLTKQGCKLKRNERPHECLLFPLVLNVKPNGKRDTEYYKIQINCPQTKALVKQLLSRK